MEPVFVAVVAIAATVIGVVLGFVVRSTFASRAMKDADEKAALIIEQPQGLAKPVVKAG